MIVKFTEVYESRKGTTSISSNPTHRSFDTRDIYINPAHVVCIREEGPRFGNLLRENTAANVNPDNTFTRVFINRGQTGIDVTVVGSAVQVTEQLAQNSQVLCG